MSFASEAQRRGRTLKLFLTDGTPLGVITAELGGSSMRAVVASRTALPDLIRREEAKQTGIYLLLGPDPELPDRFQVYVGEGDQVRTRLAEHDRDESEYFFTRALLIISKDENLTKAHGRFLEGRMIAAIKNAGRARLANSTEPDIRGLPEAEVADMERLLDEIEILLPVLGFDVMRVSGSAQEAEAAPASANAGSPGDGMAAPFFVAEIKQARARAVERGGEFIILAGSTAIKAETPGIPESVANRRKALVESQHLVPDDNPDLLRFNQDVSFGSPSGASACMAGRSDNGRATWRVEGHGMNYDLWRTGRLEQAKRSS